MVFIFGRCFCLWRLAWKQQLIYTFLISVNIVFLQILWPIDWSGPSRHSDQLPLMSVNFHSWLELLWHDWPLWSCHILVPCTFPWHVILSLIVTTHNSAALKENGMTEDIFIFSSFCVDQFFVSGHQTQKSPCLCPQVFIVKNTPISPSWWVPSNGQEFFFYFLFLYLTFLITIVPLNKFIIIAIIIVIMSYF